MGPTVKPSSIIELELWLQIVFAQESCACIEDSKKNLSQCGNSSIQPVIPISHLHKGSQRHWAKQSLSKCVTFGVNSWERQRRAAVIVFLSLFVARLRFILRFWRRWQEFYWFLDKILWFTVWNQNLQNDEFTLYSSTWVINKFIFECFFEDISPFCGAADALFWTAHYVCLQWRIQDSQRRWQPEGGGC